VSAGPSLYRRHRPRTFAEVVGQDHVVRTLSNAVARERIHHAYLFVGSRGTGKTSMAKILAACLNCERGPTIEPCGTCESCISIASATSLDVAEMDAASSNSVDDIRALRESVAYAPVSGRQKIYILDEAHMLSSAAWNAFLKTLEEPPPNTVFVLATTEAQKVPATVIDRCHRFDFQRPNAEQIAIVLRRAVAAESITISDEALILLARHAAGSFRDALGTLEQLQTYSGGEISLPDVLAVLGISDAELLFVALDAIAAADPRAALLAVASAVDGGREATTFARELEAHARELLVVQTLGGTVPAELRLTAERDERVISQAEQTGPVTLVRLLDLLAAALIAVRAGGDARTQLELAVVRAARPDFDPSAAAFAARLERLERDGGARTPSGAQPNTIALRAEQPSEPIEPPAPIETPTPTDPPTPIAPPVPADVPVPVDPPAPTDIPVPDEVPAPSDPPAPVESPTPVEPTLPDEVPATAAVAATNGHDADGSPPAASPAPASAPTAGPLTLASIVALWPEVLETVRASNAMLGAFVAEAQPVELVGTRLVLAFAQDAAFQRRKVEDRVNHNVLTAALTQVTGSPLSIDYQLREREAQVQAAPLSEAEFVRRFKDEFDAEELVDAHEESH
jgi:DNA polymerase III subunit gamma/tau